MEVLTAVLLPVLLLASSALGWRVRTLLTETHRRAETADALRLVMSMLITCAALVLGMLTSSAKTQFDAHRQNLQAYGITLIELDQRLREYGPDANAARTLLRAYTAASIADTWPDERHPEGSYPKPAHAPGESGLESASLGAMLLGVDEYIARLVGATALQRQLSPVLEARMSAVLQQRWLLVSSTQSTLPWPFLSVMVLWLMLVFATFGLSTSGNALVYVVIVLTAVSMSAAVYLIIDLDTPSTGLVNWSSTPLREALMHMDALPAAVPDN